MIDVGKGYRQLEPGKDVRQAGDEVGFLDERSIRWRPISIFVVGLLVPEPYIGLIYRRPISQEKTEDAE